ncbi:hypothetical protein HMPREF0216_01875 [Clostridium celatum DSM 1785]|uniref:Uncharacterized protein n=2 Tax=Clostridium celatum TaxID=36834 RepID=L1QG83_9CLOT|nr:hypothetical protein HMPREF0216_01875 [Clostridium celatum DSM 1785]
MVYDEGVEFSMNKNIKRIIEALMIASILGSNIMFVGCTNKNITNNTGIDQLEENKDQQNNSEENEDNEREEIENNAQSQELQNNINAENISLSTDGNEYLSNEPQIVDNVVCISPKSVYYKDGKLIMNAYVYNGFEYEIFNINNVTIKLGNGQELIAEANFGALNDLTLECKSYAEWTFTFEADAVIINDSDLSQLTWETNCSYSYQNYILV